MLGLLRLCGKVKALTDDLEALWGKFNQVARSEVALEESRVASLVMEGKVVVAAYQKQVRVALALIKAAEPKPKGGGKRTAASLSVQGGNSTVGNRWQPNALALCMRFSSRQRDGDDLGAAGAST